MLNWGLALFGGFAGAILTVLWQDFGARRRALVLVLADLTHVHDMLEEWIRICVIPPHDVAGPIIPELRSSSVLGNAMAYLPAPVIDSWFDMESLIREVRTLNGLTRERLDQLEGPSVVSRRKDIDRVKQQRIDTVLQHIEKLDEAIARVRRLLLPWWRRRRALPKTESPSPVA